MTTEKDDCMEIVLKQIVDKISSYNIFNNLYPGILLSFLWKILFDINLLSDNWFENLILLYFIGMVTSRIGSVIIKPIMKKIRIKKKSLLRFAPYSDYERASKEDPLVATLSETNNTYRTLLSCFICTFVFKICDVINKVCIENKFTFFHENKDWIALILLIILFAFSYVKQTSYVRKRVESIIKRTNAKIDSKP